MWILWLLVKMKSGLQPFHIPSVILNAFGLPLDKFPTWLIFSDIHSSFLSSHLISHFLPGLR